MDKNVFVDKVIKRITESYTMDPFDVGHIRSTIANQLFHRGYTIDDAVAYVTCFEEVQPSLPEEIALARMEKIEAKYQK